MYITKIAKKTAKTFLKSFQQIVWYYFAGKKLSKFKNVHEGEDCFVIGNGPSLNNMDLRLLNNYYTFGLNKIYLIFSRQDLTITYHVCVNPLVIKQSKKDIENLKCPSFISFRPGIINGYKGNNIYFIENSGDIQFCKDIINDFISCSYTVTYTALQLAYYMGFKRVFLIGVDHNFKQEGKPNETRFMEGPDINHFDKNYFKGQKWQLADLKNSEICYFIAKKNFEDDQRIILDATVKGKLDIFRKITFEKALKMAKKKKNEIN